MIPILDLVKSSSDYVVVAIVLLGGAIYNQNLIIKKKYLTIERYEIDRVNDDKLRSALMKPVKDELEKIEATMQRESKMFFDRFDSITARLDTIISKK